MKRFRALIGIAVLFSACQGGSSDKADESLQLPFYNSPDFTPEWIAETHPRYELIHTIAPFSFTNQHGETVSQSDLDGKIYVADFFFTECTGICPKMAHNFAKVQEAFLDDPRVMLLSHSVLPSSDSVPRLNAYADATGAVKDKWHMVTGDVEEIYKIARVSYFAEEAKGIAKAPDEFLHTENFILIDQKRRIRGIYNGTLEVDVTRLIEDIKTLQATG